MATLKRVPKATIAALFCVPAFLIMVVVLQYYTWEMPQSIDTDAGRVIAILVNYGRTVYVTSIERAVLYGSYVILAVTVVVALVLQLLSSQREP